jgi:RNA polymerase sigma-70 factor (ECF subfamily)
LYTSVRNKFLKGIAHQKVRSNHAEAFLNLFEDGVRSTDLYITEKELIKKVEELISHLPPKMAQAFTLSRINHYSNQEIAEKLNVSEKTVRNLVSQAATHLKPKIGLGIMLLLLNL